MAPHVRTVPPRLALAAGLLLAATGAARAGDGADPHAHCHPGMEGMKRAQRSTVEVTLPAVELVREDGKAISLPAALDDGRPVALEFVFTTCTTICPVLSGNFHRLQEKLGDRVHLVSISIDPEQDTPARLTDYARRYHAGPGWDFLTGTVAASVEVQRAFDAYRGDKMNHTPVTFLRAAPGRRWSRIDGFASAEELAREIHDLVATR